MWLQLRPRHRFLEAPLQSWPNRQESGCQSPSSSPHSFLPHTVLPPPSNHRPAPLFKPQNPELRTMISLFIQRSYRTTSVAATSFNQWSKPSGRSRFLHSHALSRPGPLSSQTTGLSPSKTNLEAW